jgi:tetratricopeptide (TPR) repeat protein
LAAVALIAVWSVISIRLVDTWRDTGTLWTRQIDVQPIGRAYRDRALYYQETGQLQAALADYSTAIGIAQGVDWPHRHNLFAFRGALLARMGRHREAADDFSEALRLFPHRSYHHLRGLALLELGKVEEARDDFRLAGPDPPPLAWF